ELCKKITSRGTGGHADLLGAAHQTVFKFRCAVARDLWEVNDTKRRFGVFFRLSHSLTTPGGSEMRTAREDVWEVANESWRQFEERYGSSPVEKLDRRHGRGGDCPRCRGAIPRQS